MDNDVLRRIRHALGQKGLTLQKAAARTGVPISFFVGRGSITKIQAKIIGDFTGVLTKEILKHPLVKIT